MKKKKSNKKLLQLPKENKKKNIELTNNPLELVRIAIQSGNIDAVEKMMNLNDRVRKQQAEMAYRDAMSKFQAECPIIKKRKVVRDKDGVKRYKYAPIEDIVKQIQPLFDKHGFSFKVNTEITTGESPGLGVIAKVIVFHALGHIEETQFWAPFDSKQYMTEAQKWGSTATFAKRNALMNAFGIVTADEDDDANDPDCLERLEEEKKREEEVLGRMKALPKYIKEGFLHLGYNKITVIQFCEDRNWDNEKIKAAIDKIIGK